MTNNPKEIFEETANQTGENALEGTHIKSLSPYDATALMGSLPKAEDLTGGALDAYNKLIEKIDPYNSETVAGFSEAPLMPVMETSIRIIEESKKKTPSKVTDALQDIITLISDDKISDSVSNVVNKGAEFAKKHPKETTVAAGSVAVGLPLLGALALAWASVKGKIPKYSTATPADPTKEEDPVKRIKAVEKRLIAAVNAAPEKVEALKIAAETMPQRLRRIDELEKANSLAYAGTTISLVAGNEVLKTIEAKLLPEARIKLNENASYDNARNVAELEKTYKTLKSEVGIIMLGRNESVASITHMATISEAMLKAHESIQSILTSEVSRWMRDMAGSLTAIDANDVVRMVNDFRDGAEQVAKDTNALIGHISESADRMSYDHPDRIEEKIRLTRELETTLRNAIGLHEKGEGLMALTAQKMKELGEVTDDLVNTQIEHNAAMKTKPNLPQPEPTE